MSSPRWTFTDNSGDQALDVAAGEPSSAPKVIEPDLWTMYRQLAG